MTPLPISVYNASMKLISWNVNGFRAVLKKGFMDFFREADADIFCIQETKMQEGQADVVIDGYHEYWNSAQKKGYSGTAVFSKKEPLWVKYDFGDDIHRTEGRVTTLKFDAFTLVTAYSPNAQPELARIGYRMEWEDGFRAYLSELRKDGPVIVCGDMNVARTPIDLRHPKANEGKAGYSEQERGKMNELLASGFTDSFRYFYPDKEDAYTWWSYRTRARDTNAGWRIDYFLVSDDMTDKMKDSIIYSGVYGSDHCPVGLILK